MSNEKVKNSELPTATPETGDSITGTKVNDDGSFTACKFPFADFGGGGLSYKVYRVKMFQSSSGNPTVSVLENTLGTVVWTRTSAGSYEGALAGAFPDVNKVQFYFGSNMNGLFACIAGYVTDANTLSVYSQDNNGTNGAGSYVDNLIGGIDVTILVYP